MSFFNFSDRISNSILVGPEQRTPYNEFMVCAISNSNNTNYTYKYDRETKKVTLRGKMEDILNGTRTKSVTFCLKFFENFTIFPVRWIFCHIHPVIDLTYLFPSLSFPCSPSC